MKRCFRPAGIGLTVLGLLIVLSILLPVEFFWLLVGAGLLAVGIKLLRCS